MFDGGRSTKNWVGQIILALDFDGGITPQAAIDRIQAYDITPNLWYPTYSDSPQKRKFRLVFFLDSFITSADARDYLMDALFDMYPEADKACKNSAHFFYGTNKRGHLLNNKSISLKAFLSALEADKLKSGARARKIKAGSTGAEFLRKIGESCASYIDYIEDTENANMNNSDYYEKLKQNKSSKNVD